MQVNWQANLTSELALRYAPLREAWEARGPGLLKGVTRRTSERFLPPVATVIPQLPLAGAGGVADAASGSVSINAVLANPHAQLPEVVRLAWLLAQLGVAAERRDRETQSLALAAVTIDAAQDVELARFDPSTIELAMDVWNLAEKQNAAALADVLARWWNSHGVEDTAWETRVGQLAKQMTQFDRTAS